MSHDRRTGRVHRAAGTLVVAGLLITPVSLLADSGPTTNPVEPVKLDISATAQTAPATGPAATEPERRGLDAPFDSPPFPSSDFIGPVIGTRDTLDKQPLETLLSKTPIDDALYNNRLRVYGWINGSINASTSKHGNFPETYDIDPNVPALDQFVFRVERVPDTVQTDGIDWGFRSTHMYGIDYRWTTAKGWVSSQLIDHNYLYGYDPVEQYALIYFPMIGQGAVLTIGRYISPPDIEAQLAPQNYLFTHSVFFDFDAYTYTGANISIKLDDHWTILIGAHAGNDMAPWQDSAAPNGQLLMRWVSNENKDSVWAGVSSIGDGQYRHDHDNLQQFNATWTHKFNEYIHTSTEWYFLYQFNAEMGGSASYGPVRSFGFGGGPGPVIPGMSTEWGLVNYTEFKLTKHDYISFRNDFMADTYGQRSGFPTDYSSWTLGWGHYFTDNNFLIRPEIRYERAWDARAYDLGTRKNQITFGMDLTVFY